MQILWASVHILMHALHNFCRPYGRQLAAKFGDNHLEILRANFSAMIIIYENLRKVIQLELHWIRFSLTHIFPYKNRIYDAMLYQSYLSLTTVKIFWLGGGNLFLDFRGKSSVKLMARMFRRKIFLANKNDELFLGDEIYVRQKFCSTSSYTW